MGRSFRLVAVIAVIGLLASACVRNKQAEPGVRAITTDLQYKALQQKNAAPPNTVPPPVPGGLPTVQPFGSYPPPPPLQNTTCPTAAPTSQAQADVTPTVGSMPNPGTYLWEVNGTQKVDKDKIPLPHFTERKIENVKGSVTNGNAESTFETEEKELGIGPGATVRSFYSVTAKTTTNNNVRREEQGVTVASGRTGTSGVRLVRIEKTFQGQTATFVPTQPIRILVTPVSIGPIQFWQDQVVDSSGSQPQVFTQKAYVKGRITIDACGERLRGWLVSADQTYQEGSDTVTRHIEYGVATQLGGIVLYDNVQTPCAQKNCSDATLVYTDNLGKKI